MNVANLQFEKVFQNQLNPKKTKSREEWSGRLDFFFAALGYAVGLGAVWRFPYLCYKNGGGVFLIPYFVFLLLVGIPLVFLELCVGQYTSSGPLTCWQMCPLFRGVGISMNIVNFFLLIYYNMILAYSLYFLVLSFNSVLPWQYCNKQWSSINCVDNYSNNFTYIACNDINSTIKCNDGRCYDKFTTTGKNANCNMNKSELSYIGWWNPTFPSQDYWNNVILNKSSDISNTGSLSWQLIVSLFVAWLIVFLMVFRGVKVSGKLAYFTSLFPYAILLVLGIRGWMLDGAADGIKFYISPDFSRLSDITVWTDAANQIFFTLSVSYGGLVALSSYNDFSNNVMIDAIAVSISNCLTSVFAGFVIFSYIGYLAKQTGQSIDSVIQAGQGLAYVVYPYAVTTIKVAPLWAILFFLMMLILGMDTMMASVEITITSFVDLFPILAKTKLRKKSFIALLCLLLFLLGLIFCTQSGTYWVEILDTYSGGWAVLLVGALECISITWFYGFNNFRNDIQAMIGKNIAQHKLFNVWRLLWSIISPLFLIILVILSIKETKRLTSGTYVYPYWTEVLGNLITLSTIIGTVGWFIYAIIDSLFITKRPFKNWLLPNENWKPLKLENQIKARKIKRDNISNIRYPNDGELNKGYIPTITRF